VISLLWIPLLLAAALIFHVAIGYPVLLAVWRGKSRPPVAKDLNFVTSVSVVMAVHNGASMIRQKFGVLRALDYPPELVEIIIVSDGSTDETEAIVREFEATGVRLFIVPKGGKAAALNRGLSEAKGDIIFFTDVRQPLEPKCLRHLVANFADPTVGAVTGELRLVQGEHGEQADMDLYWRYEVWARKRHSEIDSLFTATGCIYAMWRKLALPLPADTLIDDAVLPLRAFLKGYRVILDTNAIAYDYPAVAGSEFRRRLRTLAGLWQVWARLPELFTGRNRMRYHFLSHKFGRLMLPWAILLFLISTVFLPPSWVRLVLLCSEASWLLLAFCNSFVPPSSPLKRLTSPARTLLVMNIASMAAVAVFFVPATKLWNTTQMQTGKADPPGHQPD
jgi:cellulose synthase/poly-beta-1,6-N-acetylglucosamine synthase-like glycosyltransferase